jgi:hypothetical protein
LTVAVLVFFVVGVSLATLFRLLLLLTGLIVRLALSGVATLLLAALTGLLSALLAFVVLVALLAFFGLVTLLILLFEIVCHELPSWESAGLPTPSKLIAIHRLVAAEDCKGWEGIPDRSDLSDVNGPERAVSNVVIRNS